MAEWFSVDEEDAEAQGRLVDAWADAPIENLETCGYILSAARDQVWAFAPESDSDEEDDDGEPVAVVVPLDDSVPERLVLAQLKQAENLWNAGRVSSGGDVGMDSFSFTPRPLDKTIRGIIRPVKGRFSVG